MQLERLLSRIHSALQDYASEFEQRALAAEYADVCAKTMRRLEQIVPLIRNGEDYQALQIAETPPPVLDVVRALSVVEAEQWRAFCRKHGLPSPEPFDERQVYLVNGLYGKKIGETHPLYRDYRGAIRARDEQQALRVLQSIRRVNPDDANAHAEFGRLARKLHGQKMAVLTAALDNGDIPRLVSTMDSIEADNWHGHEKNGVWQRALVIREKFDLESAKTRCIEIANELHALHASGQWENTLPLLAEWDNLKSQFDLTPDEKTMDIYKRVREWSSGLLSNHEKHKETGELTRKLSRLVTDLEAKSLRKVNIKDINSQILALQNGILTLTAQTATTGLLPVQTELLKHATSETQRLRTAMWLRVKVYAALYCAAAAGLLACIMAGVHWNAQRTAFQRETTAIEQGLHDQSAQQLKATLADIERYYPRLSSNPDFAQTLKKARDFVSANDAVRAHLDEQLAALNKIFADGASLSQLNELLDSLDALDAQIAQLGPAEASALRASLAGPRLKWSQALSSAQDQRTTALTGIAARAEKIIDDGLAGPAGVAQATDIARAGQAVLAEADKVPPDPARNTPAEQTAVNTIKSLQQKYATLATDARNTLAANSQLPEAGSFDDYRKAFGLLAGSSIIGDPNVASAHALAAKYPDWDATAQHIFMPGDPETWAFLARTDNTRLQPASNDQKEDIAFGRIANDNSLNNVYRATLTTIDNGQPKNATTVFLSGPLVETENRWQQNNEETVQDGTIINPDGTKTEHTAKLIRLAGQSARGEHYVGAAIAPESKLAARVHEALDPRSGAIREPLTRVLDDVRADKDSSSVYKAFIQQELFKIMRNRPRDWGMAFSPSALADADELARITGGSLQPTDWLFSANPTLTKQLNDFYAHTASQSYYDEAVQNLKKLIKLREVPLNFGGYVDAQNQPHLHAPTPGEGSTLWGLDAAGNWRRIYDIRSGQPAAAEQGVVPARLTPLLYTNDRSAAPTGP